jgi:hypothetical protein
MKVLAAIGALLLATASLHAQPSPAQPGPALRLEVAGPPVPAVAGARPGCDGDDIPDTPARAIRLATGQVQLYASHFRNRVDSGPDLLHVVHRCPVVLAGANDDDPAAYNDRAWIASPWTPDGRTILAVVHNEFQGQRRPALCPSQRYMDCWYNALTAAVSHDGGHSFQRPPGRALVAALPYRFDQLEHGHHGYFNPSNIVTSAGAQYMITFATKAGAQREGNCLLRTTAVATPDAWRGWDGSAFEAVFVDPYTQSVPPEPHVCAPVGQGGLRWPVSSLVRHAETGLFIAVMQDSGRDSGVYYSTSPDLLHWSGPALLLPAIGPGAWTCADPPPLAYSSLLDPASKDRNFETVGATAVLFATRFNVKDCRTGMDRELIRWDVRISAAAVKHPI